ncbi:RNA polymerase sigma factor [Chitinophaga filiformis]|uniref:RNA polymerase sigma-70 factor n=1 Tax=Chitinophaga filiformis TaxID=104663 RepID=A0ABY4I844_CHIFI|nr:RNA polymerase sigma-70 factor [Chitinophaga filiformis]UPK72258.1 RNA polymerase sigma-70 factor [Chitinophaga filiformis]
MTSVVKSLDWDLIIRLRDGDESAFRVVFDQYSQKIYGVAYQFLKNREQSKEVVQETLLRLWEHRLQLNSEYPLAPWLFTIARRVTLNMLRQTATSQAARKKLWLTMHPEHNDTEEAILSADLERITSQVLNTLPLQQQMVFRLSRFEGLTYEEIAARMQISVHTVKYHLTGALKTLRACFDKTEILLPVFFLTLFY